MQNNPYSPPQSHGEASQSRSRPPFSVWLVLLLLSVITALVAFGFARSLLFGMPSLLINSAGSAIAIISRLGMIAGLLITVICVWRRKQWGRWLGVFLLTAFAVLCIFAPDTAQYPNDAQRAGASFARVILMPSLFAWWAYAFGFSMKAKRYFSGLSKRT